MARTRAATGNGADPETAAAVAHDDFEEALARLREAAAAEVSPY